MIDRLCGFPITQDFSCYKEGTVQYKILSDFILTVPDDCIYPADF